jgi:hypothetical protein
MVDKPLTDGRFSMVRAQPGSFLHANGRLLSLSGVLLIAAVALAGILVGLLGTAIGEASITHQGTLYLWLLALAGVTAATYFLLLRSAVHGYSQRLYFVPIAIVVATDSLLANGVGGLFPQQIAWGCLGIIFGFAVLRTARIPVWLIVYAGIGIALGIAGQSPSSSVLDVGLSSIALLVMWLVASALVEDGGVMKFISVVAIAYWAITALGLVVYLTHVSIGSMTPLTIEMPWQGGLKNILVSGDIKGYGFIAGQAGREVTFAVCAYHFVKWRYDGRQLHGYLAALSFALFLTGYGRIPLVGGTIGFGLVLLTNQRGTRLWKVLLGVLLILAIAIPAGVASNLTNLSGRSGAVANGGSTGHLSLWSQHFGLFIEQPLTGVGTHPTSVQDAKARSVPFFHDSDPLTTVLLNEKGSRGEGGWTGLLAQRGIINGGIILALIALAIRYCFSAFPMSREGKQDMTLVRACVAASIIFYITDEAPFTVYTVSACILGQITMIAVVRTIVAAKGPRAAGRVLNRPAAADLRHVLPER